MRKLKSRAPSREELLKLAVTDADAFTALRYLRHRETTPQLEATAEAGETNLPGTEGALLDLYQSLWAPEPQVKGEDHVPPARRYWRSILSEAHETAAYQELHATTQLKELYSVMGTIGMAETVLKLVPDEDKEQLQELETKQEAADEAEATAQAAEAEADALANLLDQLAGDQAGQSAGEGNPSENGQPASSAGQSGNQSGSTDQSSNGRPQPGQRKPNQGDPSFTSEESASQATSQVSPGSLTPEQAQELANQLAEAKAKASKARATADEAAFAAELAAEELLGAPGSQDAQEKLNELARLGLSALQKAKEDVEEVSETLQAWGIDPAELTKGGMPEALGICQKLQSNPAFKKVAALLGRLRRIVARKARSKERGEGRRVSKVDYGRQLARAHTSELVSLASPATRPQALRRWVRGELRLHGQEVKHQLGHGPVIVCEDGSGSMGGRKAEWARAVSLAMAHYAKCQRRSFGWIYFDYHVHVAKKFQQGKLGPKDLLEIAEARAGGGTNFEAPLTRALSIIKEEGLKKADILLITDGECGVSDQFIRELKATREQLEVNVVTILCDVGSSANSTVSQFSDRVEQVSAFTTESAEMSIFRHF